VARRGYPAKGEGKVRRIGVGLLIALLGFPAMAADTDAAFKWAAAGYGVGVFADAWTSERAFDAGYGEMNATLPRYPTDSRFFAQVIVVDGAVFLYARHLHKTGRPGWARAVLIAGAVIHLAAAAHNDRIWDSDR
jgi:hypothetical protein